MRRQSKNNLHIAKLACCLFLLATPANSSQSEKGIYLAQAQIGAIIRGAATAGKAIIKLTRGSNVITIAKTLKALKELKKPLTKLEEGQNLAKAGQKGNKLAREAIDEAKQNGGENKDQDENVEEGPEEPAATPNNVASPSPNSNACLDECTERSSFGNKSIKEADADRIAKMWQDMRKEDVKSCRIACEKEPTRDGCKACAKRTLANEKLEQQEASLDQFKCTDEAGAGCVDVWEPKLSESSTSPVIARGPPPVGGSCLQACTDRYPFHGVTVKGWVDPDTKQYMDPSLWAQKTWNGEEFYEVLKNNPGAQVPVGKYHGFYPDCQAACFYTAPENCNACAQEQISDAKQKELRDYIQAAFPCEEHEENLAESIIGLFIPLPADMCAILY